MSWFDEAVARRQREQRVAAQNQTMVRSATPALRQQQEVEALNPLLQRLLAEYGEHVFGKSLLQKRFLVRLERPGKSGEKTWNWHWHLNSLTRDMHGIEVHPCFDAEGTIQGLELQSKARCVEIPSIDEAAIQEGLVSLYLQV
ncbi:MAG: hypothetical protein NVS4B1_27020 [Ktedonobacteraceae bacterium]